LAASALRGTAKQKRGAEAPRLPIRLYGLSQCSIECLLATLNCSSAGGGPIVAQNKMPKSVAEKIMMAISLKYIGSPPH
jgi:hypothetical protein